MWVVKRVKLLACELPTAATTTTPSCSTRMTAATTADATADVAPVTEESELAADNHPYLSYARSSSHQLFGEQLTEDTGYRMPETPPMTVTPARRSNRQIDMREVLTSAADFRAILAASQQQPDDNDLTATGQASAAVEFAPDFDAGTYLYSTTWLCRPTCTLIVPWPFLFF